MNAATNSQPGQTTSPVRAHKSALLWALVALNVILLVVLTLKHSQPAYAQAARPSDYLMVPGNVPGITTGVVFIIDTSKGELSAMTYDDTTNTISPMPKLSLEQVFKAGGNVGGGKIRPR